MPSIEELLDQAENETSAIEPVNDILEIDPETRTVLIPDSEIIFGVEADQRAERKYFRCPKIVGNNIDLSELEIYVIFQNAGGSDEENRDAYHVQDLEDTGDGYVTFSWELTEKVTRYVGQVSFVVAATRTLSDGTLQNRWSTTIATGKSLIGLQTGMSDNEQQQASDLYTQLITELNAKAEIKKSEITTLTNEKKSLLENTGTNQKNLVESEGTKQIQAVENKGTATLATIPEDYTALNTSVNDLKDLMHMKAPAIVEEATSGKEITVNDSADGMRLQKLNVYGKSEQVTTTGANLAKPKLQSGLRSGITVTKYDDGSYNFKGTCTGDIYAEVCTIDVEIGKTYYFSGGAENGSSTTFQTYIISKDYSEIVGYNLVKKSFKANKELYYLNCAIYKGATVDFTIKPMLNIGSEALPFEPYTGGKPSPSPEYPQEIVSVGGSGSIGVEITGKNLINADEYYSQFKQSDGTYKAKTVTLNDIRISLSEFVGKEITISVKLTVGANASGVFLMYISSEQKKINGSAIKSGLTGKSILTITPVSNTDYFVISFGSGNDDVIFSKLQLELSSVATSYEPYKQPQSLPITTPTGLPAIPVPSGTSGITYTDADGQAWIADEIDFARGKYIQRVWQAEFDGSEDEKWFYDKGSNGFVINGLMKQNVVNRACISNKYLFDVNSVGIIPRIQTGWRGTAGDVIVVIGSFVDTDLDDKGLGNFKADLAATPLKVMTYLDNPIETDLSEEQIQAYKAIHTNKPTTIISNNADAWMGASYAADTKIWIENKIKEIVTS